MRIHMLAPIALLAFVACSSDPAGPGENNQQAAEWVLDLEVTSIVVKEMCDEFPIDIDGGEWSHVLSVRFPGETSIALGQTASYPSASSIKNVGRGGTLALDAVGRKQTRTDASENGDAVTLTISATEWDYDIFGNNPTGDSRMNNRSATKTITFSDGAWPEEPTGVLRLQNTGSCVVDVNYSFEAVKQ